MSRRSGKRGVGVVGVGVAACAACCVGPIVGFVAATGLFTVAGVATFGAAGLLALVPAGVWWHRRRLRVAACAAADEPVPVEIGGRP